MQDTGKKDGGVYPRTIFYKVSITQIKKDKGEHLCKEMILIKNNRLKARQEEK